MKLTDLNNIEFKKDEVQKIVFFDIDDNGNSCKYAFVFGHHMLIKERTEKAIEMYKNGRVKKLIFLGGAYGDSNSSNIYIPEAHQMRDYAIARGVNEKDILVEDTSKNTYENVINGIKLIEDENVSKIMIITSEFHLKRCMGLVKMQVPFIETILVAAEDSTNDKNTWFLTDNEWEVLGKHGSGKSLVTNEAKLLIDYAIEGKIPDFEIKK